MNKKKFANQIVLIIFGLLVVSEVLIIVAILTHLFDDPEEEWGSLALAGIIIPFICFWLNEKYKVRSSD